MRRILLLSNMWPHVDNVSSGTFVKKMMDQLEFGDAHQVEKCVLRPHRFKVVAYLSFYVRAFCAMVFVRDYVLYCHFISHTGLLALVGRYLFRKRVILNCHGTDIVLPAKTEGFVHTLNAIVLRSADKVIVPSNYFSRLLLDKFNISKNTVFVYPSGGVFYPADWQKPERPWLKDSITFGYVGSLSTLKGVRIIAQCMNQIGFRCRLLVAGAGDDQLLSSIDNPLVEIIYYGVLSRQDLNKLYMSIDVLLFPSLLEESLGLSPIEAMAFGVPVVASEIGAVSEYVEDGKNGFLVQPGSVNDLRLALLKIRNLSQSEYISFGLRARGIAIEYDENKIARDYRSIIRKVCNDGQV